MHRYFRASILVIFLLFVAAKRMDAQSFVSIGSFSMCANGATSMPVTAKNLIGVDSLRLVLAFDPSVMTYVEYFGLHISFNGGNFSISNQTDSLIMTWHRTTPASMVSDTLVWLKFKGNTGSCNLTWSKTGSVCHSTTGYVPLILSDGSVLVGSKIKVSLSQIDATCSSVCEANFMASATGGASPLTYLWNNKPGRFDSIQTGLCSGSNRITITDAWGCRLDSLFSVQGLPGASVKLIIEGNEDTTIYLQNPVLKFSFQEIAPTHIVEPPLWEFGDGDTAREFNPTHVFSRANTNTDGFYDVKLHIVNENGCDSLIEVRIPVKEADLKISGVLTPNADSFNDSFLIINQNKTGSGEETKITTEFQRMELVVFDRWGRKIYDDSNYQSDWIAKGVPDGAYYYVLKTVGYYKSDTYKGSLMILGSSANQ
jgi:PKD repeat protein